MDVGFIGAVTEDLPTLVSPDAISELEVRDIADSVNAEAAGYMLRGFFESIRRHIAFEQQFMLRGSLAA